jgi:acetoin utilization deacetylase AcuC-like enzyme
LAMDTKIVFSEKCLGYGAWHIEGPQRVKTAHDVLKEEGYKFVEPAPAPEESLLKVHDAEYVWKEWCGVGCLHEGFLLFEWHCGGGEKLG